MTEHDPAQDYDDEDPRRISRETRERMARDMGKDLAYVDALIERMAAGWRDRDPDHDLPAGALDEEEDEEEDGE